MHKIPTETLLRRNRDAAGRSVKLIRAASTEEIASSNDTDGKPFVLLIASEGTQLHSLTEQVAREWVNAGAIYICAWGPNAEQIEETFDYATFLPELGEPLPFILMTTSHKNETLGEALWFAFYNAFPADDFHAPLENIVLVVDSRNLERQCKSWLKREGYVCRIALK